MVKAELSHQTRCERRASHVADRTDRKGKTEIERRQTVRPCKTKAAPEIQLNSPAKLADAMAR